MVNVFTTELPRICSALPLAKIPTMASKHLNFFTRNGQLKIQVISIHKKIIFSKLIETNLHWFNTNMIFVTTRLLFSFKESQVCSPMTNLAMNMNDLLSHSLEQAIQPLVESPLDDSLQTDTTSRDSGIWEEKYSINSCKLTISRSSAARRLRFAGLFAEETYCVWENSQCCQRNS